MRVTNRHVKWCTPWLKLLLLLLLIPISVPAQDNPRELVVKMVQNELGYPDRIDCRRWQRRSHRAVAGGGAGAGTQILTRGKSVKVPAETTLRFKLDQPLMLLAAY